MTVRLQESSGVGAPLLSTKLTIPPARRALVARPRLLARLDGGLDRSLTLVSAAAGFGKSTLISQWLRQVERPVAWISLDAGDDDPTLFTRYLMAALQTVAPGVGEGALQLLSSPQPPPLTALVIPLINDLAEMREPAILVLDDYHFLRDATIHEGMTLLLERKPPTLHIVIATREDPPLPLARLRARQQVNEVRAAHLRFAAEESLSFLNEVMALTLSDGDVARLESRTEGWIAGLQLAALSLQENADVGGFISSFAGTNRFVVDYLVEEVLAQQAPDVQSFLLQSSLLDRLSAPLCDHVLGRSDSRSILEELERANLFLIPLDHHQEWFRYHPLFADLLRHRLREQYDTRIPILHRLAAQWYDAAGLAPEAFQQALAAKDADLMLDLLERHAERMWMHGEQLTLLRWFDAVPKAALWSRPLLALMHAWTLASLYPAQHEPVETMLGELSARIETEPLADGERARLNGIKAAILSAVASNQPYPLRTIELARESLTLLAEENTFWRLISLINLGGALAARGEMQASEQALREAIQLSEQNRNAYSALVANRVLADVRLHHGALHGAAALYQRAMQIATAEGWQKLSFTGYLYLSMARLQYEWDDLNGAREYLRSAEQTIGLADRPLALMELSYLLACIARASGEPTSPLIREIESRRLDTVMPVPALVINGYLARLYTWEGRIEVAARLAEQALEEAAGFAEIARQFARFTLVRVRIAQRRPDEALLVLDSLQAEAAAAGQRGALIEAQLFRSLALQGQGQIEEGVEWLAQALWAAEPEGYIRLFLDEAPALTGLLERLRARHSFLSLKPTIAYLNRLLAAAGIESPTAEPEADSLSTRELEVLRLIDQGLSNREIASRLVIAVSTVKWYTNIMYSKLQVHDRAAALARARELGILRP